MRQLLHARRFLQDQSGATAIEYGLIVAGISVAIIAAIQAVSGQISGTFNTIAGAMANAGK